MPILRSAERIGSRLSDRYELRAILARGGMGVLYDGLDLRTDRSVVVKLPRPGDLDDERRVLRFVRETDVAWRLRHPNIVAVLDVSRGEPPYLVMERLEGKPLSSLLSELGTLSAELTLELLLPIVEAVTHVQSAGILHRDLKPSNIFLHRDTAGRWVPKLLDFGIAKLPDAGDITHAGEVVGTPEYMSPEQMVGAALDARADVWSMGVILYRCLYGALPFTADRVEAAWLGVLGHGRPLLGQRAPGLPAQLAAAVDRALEPDRSKRYADMRELARALIAAARGTGIRLPRASARRLAARARGSESKRTNAR